MNAIKNIKGTHDILPEEVCKWQELEKIVRNICSQFGYHEIRTPVFEETRLFQEPLVKIQISFQKKCTHGRIEMVNH